MMVRPKPAAVADRHAATRVLTLIMDHGLVWRQAHAVDVVVTGNQLEQIDAADEDKHRSGGGRGRQGHGQGEQKSTLTFVPTTAAGITRRGTGQMMVNRRHRLYHVYMQQAARGFWRYGEAGICAQGSAGRGKGRTVLTRSGCLLSSQSYFVQMGKPLNQF